MFKQFVLVLVSLFSMAAFSVAHGQQDPIKNYRLAAGDAVRIKVFKHDDLTLDARVSENGNITYPLIGAVKIGGLTVADAERQITLGLARGGFVKDPQVTMILMQVRGNRVSVLGHVNRPGRFPLETLNTRLADVLAMAGGINPAGSDVVIVTGERNGNAFRKEIDFPAVFAGQNQDQNILISGGDVVFVSQAPMYYIYGQVQRPGSYRIERDMTVQQALALGGGINSRGTESGIRLHRKKTDGSVESISPESYDLVQPNDVIYVRESIF